MQLDSTLAALGFTLQAAVKVATLPAALSQAAPGFTHLLVFGHGGKLFWDKAARAVGDTANPLDDYSVDCVLDYLARSHIAEFEIIYPTDEFALDLRLLGRHLGWQFESPLGIGIHPVFGLWSGYRVVVAARAEIPFTAPVKQSHPCDRCIEKPCIAACPIGAVGEPFNLAACVSERTRPASACAVGCASRLACPVGAEHRYQEAQINYHAGVSLAALKRNL